MRQGLTLRNFKAGRFPFAGPVPHLSPACSAEARSASISRPGGRDDKTMGAGVSSILRADRGYKPGGGDYIFPNIASISFSASASL